MNEGGCGPLLLGAIVAFVVWLIVAASNSADDAGARRARCVERGGIAFTTRDSVGCIKGVIISTDSAAVTP